jgi:hypothetical protein
MQRGTRRPVSVFHTNKVNREFSIKNGTNLQNAEKKSTKIEKFTESS